MISYFDSSAVVPLVLDEPGSATALRTWLASERVISSRVTYVEARAALAAATRSGRVAAENLAALVRRLDTVINDLQAVDIDDALVRRAGNLAEEHAMRGFDAIHMASAEAVADVDLVMVAGIRRLLAAARNLGFTVISTSP